MTADGSAPDTADTPTAGPDVSPSVASEGVVEGLREDDPATAPGFGPTARFIGITNVEALGLWP